MVFLNQWTKKPFGSQLWHSTHRLKIRFGASSVSFLHHWANVTDCWDVLLLAAVTDLASGRVGDTLQTAHLHPTQQGGTQLWLSSPSLTTSPSSCSRRPFSQPLLPLHGAIELLSPWPRCRTAPQFLSLDSLPPPLPVSDRGSRFTSRRRRGPCPRAARAARPNSFTKSSSLAAVAAALLCS